MHLYSQLVEHFHSVNQTIFNTFCKILNFFLLQSKIKVKAASEIEDKISVAIDDYDHLNAPQNQSASAKRNSLVTGQGQ